MKIYLLRHEDRPINNPGFLTELTQLGKERSNNSLKNTLNNINFTHVYCSPFLRTIQTISPYVENKHYVNIEYGLAEGLHDEIFKNEFDCTVKNPPCHISNYKSIIDIEQYRYYEDEEQIRIRVGLFYKNLTENHKNEHHTILLVSHQCICNILLDNIRNVKERDIHEKYDMGKLVHVDETNEIIWVN
jgi:broad specificity phosphatase PhoE